MWIGPKRSRAVANALVIAAGKVTSHESAKARSLCCVSFAERLKMVTRAPCDKSPPAMASPMPRPPPVTSACFPARGCELLSEGAVTLASLIARRAPCCARAVSCREDIVSATRHRKSPAERPHAGSTRDQLGAGARWRTGRRDRKQLWYSRGPLQRCCQPLWWECLLRCESGLRRAPG